MSDTLSGYLGQVEPEKITQELQEIGVEETRIKDIHQLFWRADSYNSLISFQTYLELLKSFLVDDPDRSFTRSDFLDFALDRTIPKELRRNIQDIATSMELLQTNSLSEKEFDELLTNLEVSKDDIKFDTLLEKNIFKIGRDMNLKDETPRVLFYHHTIQEFLAVQYIESFDDPFKKLQELAGAKQGEQDVIIPSWYNVIRFMIENETKEDMPVTHWLISLGEKNPDIIEELYATALTSIDPLNFPDEVRSDIFNLIFYTYRERLLWLPLWTRRQLAQIMTEDQIKDLKDELHPPDGTWKNDKQRIVYLGLLADIVDGVMEHTADRLSESDKNFWEEKFIEFANDKNPIGVLQRNALHALEHFRKEDNDAYNISLIRKVIDAYEHPDTLVKQVFIQFTSAVAPNAEITIDCIARGISDDSVAIYGRHALYNITSVEGIRYFLKKLADDSQFLFHFLDKSSIFNDRRKKADKVLIDKIDEFAKELLPQIKTVIWKAYELEKYYDEQRSYFLVELLKIVHKNDERYLQEILEKIAAIPTPITRDRIFGDFTEAVTRIIKVSDVDFLFDWIKKVQVDRRMIAFERIIYRAKQSRAAEGEAIFRYAVDKGYIKEYSDLPERDYAAERKQNIIKEYRKKLSPAPDKYMTDVFGYYLDHEDVLVDLDHENDLLKKYLVNSALRLDPREIRVTIPDRQAGQMTVSTSMHIYGNALRLAQKLMPEELPKYRQNIINFLPFALSDDLNTIIELIPDATDSELSTFVNPIMTDQKQDIRYLTPSSYVYFIEENAKKGNVLSSSIPVLRSFVKDPDIKLYEKRSVLRTLALLLTPEADNERIFVEEVFTEAVKKRSNGEMLQLAQEANAVLISVYREPEAIEWRFKEIYRRAAPFDTKIKARFHDVGDLESEMHSKYFARPLIELGDPSFLDKDHFLGLIDRGFELLHKQEEREYESYGMYLWNIVAEAVQKIPADDGSALKILKEYLSLYADDPDMNWWNKKIEELYSRNNAINSNVNIEQVVKLVRKEGE